MRAQLGHVGLGLLGRAHVGLGDDLHQRHARAIEIDEGQFRMLVVDRLAGVLLQVQALDADLQRGSPSTSISTSPSPTIGCLYCEI